MNGFNPRPHARGDQRLLPFFAVGKCFNPRPHARGDVFLVLMIPLLLVFQSTPPREGRPPRYRDIHFLINVSIHAPTRGATIRPGNILNKSEVSIHAPTRGATSCGNTDEQQRCFNPRPHARGDLIRKTKTVKITFQSTPPREGRHSTKLRRWNNT